MSVRSKVFYLLPILLGFYIFIEGCTNPNRKSTKEKKIEPAMEVPVEYAKGFSIQYLKDGGRQIKVENQGESVSFSKTYLLYANKKGKQNYPAKRVITQSAPHWAIINELDKAEAICGLPAFNEVFNDILLTKLQTQNIVEVGKMGNQNLETILELSPDLILESSTGSAFDNYEKWEELQLPVVHFLAHLENHPLGRVEWIKYVGAFMGLEEVSNERFNEIKAGYLAVKNKLHSQNKMPKVFVGYLWKDNWYVAGGQSYMAQYISDAGGNYLRKDDLGSGNEMVGFETAVELLEKADVWLNPGYGIFSKKDLLQRTKIPAEAMGKLKIYNNNKRVNQWGRNDYWESGFVRPDLVLKDLYQIFNSSGDGDSTLFYFKLID